MTSSAPPPPHADATTEEDGRAELLKRFDAPLSRATEITRRTLAWFPIRVWRHFLQHNGFLLAAAISYQSLFAIFAAVYVAFAAVGVWLGGSQEAIDRMIDLVNRYVPGLISDDGLISPESVTEVATSSGSVLAVTGTIAVLVAIWTAIGFVTFTRRAVRDTFGLPFDRRNYFLLKARDLLAALVFGVALVVAAGLGSATTGALDALLTLVGLNDRSGPAQVFIRTLTLLVAFALNSTALAALFRFLSGASLRWRRIWPGAFLAGAAIAVLQIAVGFLLVYSPSNPLLATFSVMIGFLLWFRLNGIVILVGAAWIAVASADRDIPLRVMSEYEREVAEHEAVLTAARVRLREAQHERARAPWYRAPAAELAVRRARQGLEEAEAMPAPVKPTAGLFD